MKKTLTVLLLFIIIISCKAQSILPVENVVNYYNTMTGIPKNITQIKDVNGILNKFIGTWKGTYNSKNYEFRVVKYTRQSETRNLSVEGLLIRYKITDSNGAIIEDTTTLLDDSPYVIKGQYLAESGSYVLFYQGKESNCGQKGDLFISVYGTNDAKMKLFLEPKRDVIITEDCPNGGVAQILPTDQIDLTKQ